ncbi:hypothetical protein MPER_08471, partial [Moniliophthora perniciosa FA553]
MSLQVLIKLKMLFLADRQHLETPPVEEEDQEKFLDAFLNVIYVGPPPEGENTLTSAASALDWTSPGSEAPFYEKLKAFKLETFAVAQLVSESDCESGEVEPLPYRDVPDFCYRTTFNEHSDMFCFGDEVVELAFAGYEHYVEGIPDK